jgi:hypothetical protein
MTVQWPKMFSLLSSTTYQKFFFEPPPPPAILSAAAHTSMGNIITLTLLYNIPKVFFEPPPPILSAAAHTPMAENVRITLLYPKLYNFAFERNLLSAVLSSLSLVSVVFHRIWSKTL